MGANHPVRGIVTDRFSLAGKVAVVTGASSGLGVAYALAMAQAGAEVVIGARRADLLAATAATVREYNPAVVSVTADVTKIEDCDRLANAAVEAFGRVDILVNNAGVNRDALALRMTDADWQTVVDIDLTAAFRLTRAALRGMIRRRHGRVIAISSVVAVAGNPGQANYAAAKAAMIGMSKSIAAEVASRGITVNCIAPGYIATRMTDRLTAAQQSRLAGAIPAGRIGGPEDVAAAVVYLASSEAAYVTGHTLHVNGGLAMI